MGERICAIVGAGATTRARMPDRPDDFFLDLAAIAEAMHSLAPSPPRPDLLTRRAAVRGEVVALFRNSARPRRNQSSRVLSPPD